MLLELLFLNFIYFLAQVDCEERLFKHYAFRSQKIAAFTSNYFVKVSLKHLSSSAKINIFQYYHYLRYLGLIFTSLALIGVVSKISNSYQATEIAHMNPKKY